MNAESALARRRFSRAPSVARPRAFRRHAFEALEARFALTANGDDVRHYRLAVAATSGYTTFYGGDRLAAQAAIAAIIDEVNLVFRRELNVQLDLISSLAVVFGGDNPSADPYPADSLSAIGTNQTVLDSVLGSAAYDVGWVFGTFSDGGRATLGGAGTAGFKGSYAAGLAATPFGPTGTRFLDIVLHEGGHHFGANHSFNTTVGAAGDALGRVAAAAYEPGSGSTIMAYPGLTPAVFTEPPTGDNLQNFADLYFHSHNLAEMTAHLATLDGLGVGTREFDVNAVPTIAAGSDFTIPANTPFAITVTASDANDPEGDDLRYTIEQFDLGPAQSIDPASDNGASPLFRSFSPAASATGSLGAFTRTFPQLADVLDGGVTKGELLPTTSRPLTFRATVRDGAGGTNSDDVTVSVVNTGAPFRVTSPNVTGILTGGSSATVTWDVAGTTGSGIGVSTVRIRLSTDGGQTFPYLLATTSNDGSHDVTLPNLDTTAARVKVEAVGNIFFDISDADFTIIRSAAAPGIALAQSAGSTNVAEGGVLQSATDSYDVALNIAPLGPVEIRATAASGVELSLDGTAFSAMVTFTRSTTTPQTITVRALNDAAREGIENALIEHTVVSSGDGAYSPATVLPGVVAKVIDNERVPLVGVDFQDAAGPGGTPLNWTRITASPALDSPATFSDLVRENGSPTAFDLTVTPAASVTSFNSNTAPLDSPTTPLHSPSLAQLDDVLRWRVATGSTAAAAVDFTWKSLTPGRKYAVYVFASEFNTEFLNQTVTITGSGVDNPPPFTQLSRAGGRELERRLFINGAEGRAHSELETFATVVTANASGEININVTRDDDIDRNRIYLSGLALQEFVEPPAPLPTVAFTAAGQSGAESVGTFTVTVSLSAVAGSDVSVPFTLGGTATEGLPEDFTVTSSPAVITAGTTAATITITVNDDSTFEPNETVVLTLGSPSGATLGGIVAHTATIENNDASSHPHQNPTNRFDVNDLSGPTNTDLFLTVAELRAASPRGPRLLPLPPAAPDVPPPYWDVSGDDVLNNTDLFQLLSELRRLAALGGEGELPPTSEGEFSPTPAVAARPAVALLPAALPANEAARPYRSLSYATIADAYFAANDREFFESPALAPFGEDDMDGLAFSRGRRAGKRG